MGPRRRCLLPLVAAIALAPSVSSAQGPARAATQPQPATPPAKPAAGAKAPPHAKTGKETKPPSPVKPRAHEDATARRAIAGGPTVDDAAMGADTPELRALYAAERELFPPASPNVGTRWPDELPFPIPGGDDRPRVHASGLPPAPPSSAPPLTDAGKDLAWLAKLDLPDLPVRWDPRVVRYLEFFKDDPRGHAMLATWLRRSGRYRDAIKKTLEKKSLPKDLLWLAMIESGFDPTARSPVGAVGLWQFMPETGKIYGLGQDHWSDSRMSLAQSTEAACDFLADLYRRFGSWDLAMAAYNMGYGGVLAAVRRYNTNDYWALSKLEGSLPWETTLYVPKILAAAIVAHNLAAFGLADVVPEPPLDGEEVPVAPGTALASVATACGTSPKELEQLNPDLRASRTPPGHDDWRVLVPSGKGATCTAALAKNKHVEPGPATDRYVVKFGESIDQIAQARHVPVTKLVELNAIAPGEVLRGGTVLLVPKGEAAAEKPAPVKGDKPVAIVPRDAFVYPDRKHVFYKVQIGDTIKDVATVFHVTPDELRRWNDVDPSARLVEGMTLQVFALRDADLSKVSVLGEQDVRPIVVGTDEFFQHWEEKGRHRTVVTAKAGDTLEAIGKKHGVSAALMERINRRGRNEPLAEGDPVVLWLPASQVATGPGAQASLGHALEPETTPPLAAPPAPDRLPPLP